MKTILLLCLVPCDICDTFDDVTSVTPVTVYRDGYSIWGNGGASGIAVDPIREITVGQGTPYAFLAVQNDHQPRFWFDDPIDYFSADIQLGSRILCEPSKWHFLTSTQDQINDGWNANAEFYADDWSLLGSIPLYEGPTTRLEFQADGIKRIVFSLADPGFCQPVGIDNVCTSQVPEPSTLQLMLFGAAAGAIGIAIRKRVCP